MLIVFEFQSYQILVTKPTWFENTNKNYKIIIMLKYSLLSSFKMTANVGAMSNGGFRSKSISTGADTVK